MDVKPAALTLNNRGQLKCSISNADGWKALTVQWSETYTSNVTLIQVNNTTPLTPTFTRTGITVTENTLSSQSGHVTFKFNTTCHGANLVDYVCMVEMPDFEWREYQQVQIQRK